MKILYICDKLITFILSEITTLKDLDNDIFILAEHSGRAYDIINKPILMKNGLAENYYSLASFRNRKQKYFHFIKSLLRDLFTHPILAFKALNYIFKAYPSPKYGVVDYLDVRSFFSAGIEIIHAPFSTPRVIDKVYLLAKILTVPFTLSFRAHDIYEGSNLNEAQKRIDKIREASHIVTISDYNRRYIKDSAGFDKEIDIIHSAIDPDMFMPQGLDRAFNSIISVCRLHEQKGLIYLIRACHILNKRNIKYECTIIGEGPDKGKYEKLIDELQVPNIRFIDFISYEGVKEHLMHSTVFVLPCIIASDGKRDILANSLKEAMAMEIPVITSAICGIEELVGEGVNGILVPPHDAESIADAIGKIFKDPEHGYEMGKAGREKIKRDFNVKIEVGKLEKIFKKTVAQMRAVHEDNLLNNSGKEETCLQGNNRCL
jgi:glycosyltransferase involved in cell wall biosynthesis